MTSVFIVVMQVQPDQRERRAIVNVAEIVTVEPHLCDDSDCMVKSLISLRGENEIETSHSVVEIGSMLSISSNIRPY